MPKLKLRDWQFKLMYDAVFENFIKEEINLSKLAILESQLSKTESFLKTIAEKYTLITDLRNIVRVISEKSSSKDIFKSYDDDPPVDDSSDDYPGPSNEEKERLEDALIY